MHEKKDNKYFCESYLLFIARERKKKQMLCNKLSDSCARGGDAAATVSQLYSVFLPYVCIFRRFSSSLFALSQGSVWIKKRAATLYYNNRTHKRRGRYTCESARRVFVFTQPQRFNAKTRGRRVCVCVCGAKARNAMTLRHPGATCALAPHKSCHRATCSVLYFLSRCTARK